MQRVTTLLTWLFSFFHRFYLCVDGRRTCGVLLIFFLLAFLSPFLQKKCSAEDIKISRLFDDFKQDSLSQSDRTRIADEIIRRFRSGENQDLILDFTRNGESGSSNYVEALNYIRKELGYSNTSDLQVLRNTLANPSQDIEKRRDAVAILSNNKDSDTVPIFRSIILDPNEDSSLRTDSLCGIRTTQENNDFSEFSHILNESNFNLEEGSPQYYLIIQSGYMRNDKIFRYVSDLIFSQKIDNKKIPSKIRNAFYDAAKNSPDTRDIFLSLLRDQSIEDALFKGNLLHALLEKDIMSVDELIKYGFTENEIKNLLREKLDWKSVDSLMQGKKYPKKVKDPAPQGTETEENNEESMPERVEEEVQDKKITNSIAPCIGGGITTSAFLLQKIKKDVDEISGFVNSKNTSKLAVQRPEDTSKMYSEAKEIENHLRNAFERFEIDTQVLEIALEPIEKDIIRLRNEINGPLPYTFEKLVTEVAEVFGYNEFGTHESQYKEIEKKRYEIQKREREILGPAFEELESAYNEGMRFFNRHPQKKEFHPIYSNKEELLLQSHEILSEFSKLQQKQNHN